MNICLLLSYTMSLKIGAQVTSLKNAEFVNLGLIIWGSNVCVCNLCFHSCYTLSWHKLHSCVYLKNCYNERHVYGDHCTNLIGDCMIATMSSYTPVSTVVF